MTDLPVQIFCDVEDLPLSLFISHWHFYPFLKQHEAGAYERVWMALVDFNFSQAFTNI
jgi:hypothetical protein